MDTKFELMLRRIEGRIDGIKSTPAAAITGSSTEVERPFQVRFARDEDDMINRDRYMTKIDEKFKAYQRVALYGLGGTG